MKTIVIKPQLARVCNACLFILSFTTTLQPASPRLQRLLTYLVVCNDTASIQS